MGKENMKAHYLETLSETLDTEIKSWLDPDKPVEAAKIAKACIALRNNNGGQLILGFDDKSLRKSVKGIPADVKKTYHADVIQRIVSKYALPKFDVEVIFEDKAGQTHPIILVKGGIEYPVMTKSSFEGEVRLNTVYVRALSNNTVSSSKPKTQDDWDRLIRICFDNREADIGRFFKRHIRAISSELTSASNTSPSEGFLRAGREAFELKLKERAAAGSLKPLPDHGIREVAFVMEGPFNRIPLVDLLNTVFARQPHFTGWPAWLDSRSLDNAAFRPYRREDGWEAFITERHLGHGVMVQDFTFWRIENNGKFYQLRTLDDDAAKSFGGSVNKPGTVLDPVLLFIRTAEIIATAKAFAGSLATDATEVALEFSFRWSGLKGRRLFCWAGRNYPVLGLPAEKDEVLTTHSIPLDLPQSRIWEAVKAVTLEVFESFGSGVDDSTVESLTKEVLNRGKMTP
jgi:hypothetical protein